MRTPSKIARPYGSSSGDRRSHCLWKNPNQDAPAVERRDREEIEHRQHHVDDQTVLQIFGNPWRQGRRQITDKVEQQSGDNSQRYVHCRPGGGDQNHVATRVAQRPKIDGHRFRIAKQERRVHQQQDAGQEYGAHRINMLQRIEADPPEPPCRVIPQKVSGEAVGGLMKRDGDEDRNDPDRRQVDCLSSH